MSEGVKWGAREARLAEAVSRQRWCLAQTHASQERVAVENLVRQSFEHYLPQRQKVVLVKGQPPRTVSTPLFPGYVFVRVSLEVARWRSLYATRGIKSVFGTVDGGPRRLPDKLIEDIRTQEVDGFIHLTPTGLDCGFKAGETVSYGGYLKAIFQEPVDGRRAVILVSLLGSDSLQTVDLINLSPDT